MRTTWLFLALTILCAASTVQAQGGTLMLFSDPSGLDCDLHDDAPGLCTYYVVHMGTAGATASQFAAPKPACHMGIFLSDTGQYAVTIGSSQTGTAIGYGACLSSPIHILTINFFCQGLTGECCMYSIVPDPNIASGQIEVVDCSETLVYGSGGTSAVNPTVSCCCQCTPAKESTWGKVKSLYVN